MSVPVESDEPSNAVRQSTFFNTIDRNANEIEVLQKSGTNAVNAVVVQTVTNGDSTHAPSGDAVYDFTNSIIVQTVTNGDTTHVPSADAVFDYVAPVTRVAAMQGTFIVATTVPFTVKLDGGAVAVAALKVVGLSYVVGTAGRYVRDTGSGTASVVKPLCIPTA